MKKTPSNLEAEQIVLAGLCIGLYEPRAVHISDFYDEKHKSLFKVILSLLEQVSVIDSLLLYNEVERLKLNAKVGGELNVIDIVDGKHLEAKSNPLYWLRKLKETTQKRELTYLSLKIGDLSQMELTNRLMEIYKITEVDSEVDTEKEDWVKPLSPEVMYGLAGEVVRAIEPHSESDTAALLFSFLTAFGNVIGNTAYMSVEADKHPARLFAVLVGKSSKGRKGTSWGYIQKIFEQIDPLWAENIVNGLSSGEGVISAVRDESIKKVPEKEGKEVVGFVDVIEHPGVEDKRLMVYESEFAQALKVMEREGNILSPIIRNSWDTGNIRTLTKNSPVKATGAHISIIGHITKNELLRYLRSTEQANGFGNRFLWVSVERSKLLPFGGKVDSYILQELTKRVKSAAEFAGKCSLINWSDEAKFLWEETYPELSREKPGIIGMMLGRAEAYTLRLSLVYALLDQSKTIEVVHLMAALAVMHYCEDSVRNIFRHRTGSEDADKIRKALEKEGRLSRTDINRKVFHSNRTSEEIDTAIDELLFINGVIVKKESTNGKKITYLELPIKEERKKEGVEV